jgi:hypothetical protein
MPTCDGLKAGGEYGNVAAVQGELCVRGPRAWFVVTP